MRSELVEVQIAAVAERQGGVISCTQLYALGLDRHAVGRRLRAGRLHRLHRGVYAVGHAHLGGLGRSMAAVLACGDGAVLGHASAADAWDLLPSASTYIDVTVPTAGGRAKHDRIRIHRVPGLPAEHCTKRGPLLPITTPERTLLDLAATTSRDRLTKALGRAETRGLTDHVTLTELCASRRHGAAKLREALTTPRPRTRSELEDAMSRLCVEHGIPRPLVNHPIGPYIVDFFWPDAKLIVETDGWEHHGTRSAFQADRRRDAHLTAAGHRVIRFTYDDVTKHDAVTARLIQAARRPARAPDTPGTTAGPARRTAGTR